MAQIELSIVKSALPGGGTRYSLSPDRISLGGYLASMVDTMRLSGLPEEWDEMTVRFTFKPRGAASVVKILDDTRIIDVKSEITRYAQGGRLLVDVTDGDYTAFAADIPWTVYNHIEAGGETPTPPEDDWKQLVATIQGYSNAAVAAKNSAAVSETAASESASAASGSAAEAESSAAAASGSAAAAEISTIESADSASEAGASAILAAQEAAKSGYVFFMIENGRLIEHIADSVTDLSFALSHGRLVVNYGS